MPTAGRKCEKGEFGSFYLLFSAKSKSPQICEIEWDPDDRTSPLNEWRCPARGPLSLAAMANDVMSGDCVLPIERWRGTHDEGEHPMLS
jgi:hypothetical protein